MRRDEILAMPSGPALDELVAEKGLGWIRGDERRGEMRWYEPENKHKRYGGRPFVPPYSTSMEAAMAVLDTMLPSPLIWREHEREPRGWHVRLRTKCYHLGAEVVCGSLPEAICKAKLLSLCEEDDPVFISDQW